MPDYRVTFSKSAERDLSRLDPSVEDRILAATEKLVTAPRPSGCVKLTGTHNEWRIRIGDWRVIYTIDDDQRIVDVTAVRHRSDAYR